jgi:predicted alpha-1,2-mannosidase
MTQFVNTLQGTHSTYEFSKGNTMPIVARPFGLNHWTIMTSEDRWTFQRNQPKVIGIQMTRRPSPWMDNWGSFGLSFATASQASGEGLFVKSWKRGATYLTKEATFKPNVCSFTLPRFNTTAHFTATERCCMINFIFPNDTPSHIMLHNYADCYISINSKTGVVEGWTTQGPEDRIPEGFKSYFILVPDVVPNTVGCFGGNIPNTEEDASAGLGITEARGENAGAVLQWTKGGTINVRIATSLISLEQARTNLAREVAKKSFNQVVAEGEKVWDNHLLRIRIKDTGPEKEALKQTFYSCLYRCFLFPRMIHEVTMANDIVHWSPYNGNVLPGYCCTDNGFWDTYRTVYPLLALIAPKELEKIMQGWVNATIENEWSPKWANPGPANAMIGTHLDVVMADALGRKISFDMEAVYQILRKDGLEEPDEAKRGRCGRTGLKYYLDLGYVPCDKVEHATSRTMDFAYNDWCLSQIAFSLLQSTGKGQYLDDAVEFAKRTNNYVHVFDKEVGMMRGRKEDGTWSEWNEFAWGGPFVEGSTWQSSFAVQHDVPGLIELFGGKGGLERKLDQMLTTKPLFTCGSYGHEIHEMSEMAAVSFGQYAHSNQPVHHILYLYTACDVPEKTQTWVKKVLKDLYSPLDLPGDEDNGEQSAWFVLSALGLFPMCPGQPDWMIGTVLFDFVDVDVQRGVLQINSVNNSVHHKGTVEQVKWNASPVKGNSFLHKDIINGGSLLFEMTKR